MEGASTSPESYVRIGRRWPRRRRGFRLCPRNRFSVRRLRAKLLTFLRLVGRYVRQLLVAGRLMRSSSAAAGGGGGGGGGCSRSSSSRFLVVGGKHHNGGRLHGRQTTRCRPVASSFMRSNSFYAQAIADCLEFIKRNSVPVEDYASSSGRRSSVDLTTI